MPPPPICFFDKAFFLVKSKTSSLQTTVLKWRIIGISGLSDVRFKEFYCAIKSLSEQKPRGYTKIYLYS
jgi:hypothetical protein